MLLLVGLANVDLLSLIPLPIAAGLVFVLGHGFLVEALAKPLARRDGLTLLLALTIMAVCVRYGYMVGVLIGIVGACLLFAVSCARSGVVRQHLSRAQFAGHVSRSAQAARLLSQQGEAIQLYWLTGYVFFGSSEGVFERVRRDLQARPAQQIRHVVLDFDTVTGVDASASVSLSKLRNFCRQAQATLSLSSLSPTVLHSLQRDGFFADERQAPAFADANVALAWCEDDLLARNGQGVDANTDFTDWLQQQLGPGVAAQDFLGFLARRCVADGTVLYHQGDAADAIDLVADGQLLIHVRTDAGQTVQARRIATQSVVGEMGFFRNLPRSATVVAEGQTTLYTLTRSAFQRMGDQRPALALAFQAYLLCTLSERMSLADRTVSALSGGLRRA